MLERVSPSGSATPPILNHLPPFFPPYLPLTHLPPSLLVSLSSSHPISLPPFLPLPFPFLLSFFSSFLSFLLCFLLPLSPSLSPFLPTYLSHFLYLAQNCTLVDLILCQLQESLSTKVHRGDKICSSNFSHINIPLYPHNFVPPLSK